MQTRIASYLRGKSGAVALEYALILMIISIIAVACMYSMGGSVQTFFGDVLTGFLLSN